MFRDKSDRQHHHRNAGGPGAAQFVVRRRFDPLQRPNAALITDQPVEAGLVKLRDDRLRRLLDLPGVGIAAFEHAHRQAMGREQHARWRGWR